MRRLNVNKSLSKDIISKYQNADAQNQEPQYVIFDLYRGGILGNRTMKGGSGNPMTAEEAFNFTNSVGELDSRIRNAVNEEERNAAIAESEQFVKDRLGRAKFKGEDVDLFLYSELNPAYELNRFVVLPAAKPGTDQRTLNNYVVNYMGGIPLEVLNEQPEFENIGEILSKLENNELTLGPYADFGKIVTNVDELGNKEYITSYVGGVLPINGIMVSSGVIADAAAPKEYDEQNKKVFDAIYKLGSTSLYMKKGLGLIYLKLWMQI